MSKERNTWSTFPYPQDIIGVAKNRLRGLMHASLLQTCTVEKLLMSAYLQGMCDAVEVTETTGIGD